MELREISNTHDNNFVHTRVQLKYWLLLNSTLSFPEKYISFILHI